ncbi:hypothetical protein [Amycolatopsis sp. NPDC051071]|uniref:hypothetical protein n=1 Tax=Amycolatopsis sp. NPDC051071 TaxID=3154637 RepID=UPI0034333B95
MSILDPAVFRDTLDVFVDHKLLSSNEADLVVALLEPTFPFAEALSIADSVHVQVKIDDLGVLPHGDIVRSGVTSQRKTPGFQKYGYANGLAVIFTSGPIAEDDLVPGAVTRPTPFVDHLGIDLREESPQSAGIYAALGERATDSGWRTVRQGGPDSPVRGCYCEVSEKRWVYPPTGTDEKYRPIEFAFGELQVFGEDVGCDYRPIDPGHPLADLVPAIAGRADQSC